MMPSDSAILLNIAYGTGPYLRSTELGLAVSDALEKSGQLQHKIIVPLIYGGKQKEIMQEECGDRMEQIILDEEYGKLLGKLLYGNETYEDYLKRWLDAVDGTSEEITAHLQATYGDSIVMQLARAPFAKLPITPSYFVSFAFHADIYKQSVGKSEISIDDALLEQATKKMEDVESGFDQSFVMEPGTFSYSPTQRDQQLIPPTLIPRENDSTEIQEGMYVTVTGIPGLDHLFQEAKELGIAIYSNDPDAVPGAKKALPSVIGNPNVLLHFARSGWSSVWTSLYTGTPFVAAPYDAKDDPEIFFNNECIKKLGLGVVYEGQPLPALLEEARGLQPNMETAKQALLDRFGTLNGITYVAEKIVNDFLQK